MMHYRPPRRASLPFRLAHHDPFPGSVVIPNFVVRKLEAQVVRAGENECWTYETERPWKPAGDPNYEPNPARYARIKWRDPETGFEQVIPAHRLAMIADSGPFNPELYGCHLCANSLCCNPRHLYAGTDKQNRADRALMEAILAAQGTTDGVVLPPHPRSRMVCEALINGEDPAPVIERERRRLDQSFRTLSSAKLSTVGGLPPSPRPRPARSSHIAAV